MTSHAIPTLPLAQPPAWTRLAACRRRWNDLDWIDPTPTQARRCRAICASCPVQRACLAYALAAAEPWGIWGGLDADQRVALARLVGLPVPRVLPQHGFRARYVKHGCRCRACRHAHAVYEHHRRHRPPAAWRGRRTSFFGGPRNTT